MNVETITIPMLTKLLVIKMVASSLCGRFSKAKIRSEALVFETSRSFFSFGPKEKKATSEPDINAEQAIKKTVAAMATQTSNVIGLKSAKIVLGGSISGGSNKLVFQQQDS